MPIKQNLCAEAIGKSTIKRPTLGYLVPQQANELENIFPFLEINIPTYIYVHIFHPYHHKAN